MFFYGKFSYAGNDIEDRFVLSTTQNSDGTFNVVGQGHNEYGEFIVNGSLTGNGVMTLVRQYEEDEDADDEDYEEETDTGVRMI